jgi:hypothetical protein
MATGYETLKAQIAQITHREDLEAQMDNFIGAANELIAVRLGITLEAPNADTQQYNDIFLNYPSLYLYASLISAYEFINEIDMADHYVARYENEITRYYITAGGSSPALVMGGGSSNDAASGTAPGTDGSLTVNGNLSVLGISTFVGDGTFNSGMIVLGGSYQVGRITAAGGIDTDNIAATVLMNITSPVFTFAGDPGLTSGTDLTVKGIATFTSDSQDTTLDVVNTAGNGGIRMRSITGNDRGDIGYVDSDGANFDNRISLSPAGATSLLYAGIPVLQTTSLGVQIQGDAQVNQGGNLTFTDTQGGKGVLLNNSQGGTMGFREWPNFDLGILDIFNTNSQININAGQDILFTSGTRIRFEAGTIIDGSNMPDENTVGLVSGDLYVDSADNIVKRWV